MPVVSLLTDFLTILLCVTVDRRRAFQYTRLPAETATANFPQDPAAQSQVLEDFPGWSSAAAHVDGREDRLVVASPLPEMVGDWGEFLNSGIGYHFANIIAIRFYREPARSPEGTKDNSPGI